MSREDPVTPHECRLRDMTYSAPIKVDLVYIKENRLVRKTGQVIGRIPIMLRSERCRLYGATEKQLFKMKECPLDPGITILDVYTVLLYNKLNQKVDTLLYVGRRRYY